MRILYRSVLIALISGLLFVGTRQKGEFSELNNPAINAIENEVELDAVTISYDELLCSVKWKRCPFTPYYHLKTRDESAFATENFFTRPVIGKTYWEQRNRFAEINGEQFSEGDNYLNMKIMYIGESVVLFEREGIPCLLLTIEKDNNQDQQDAKF